MADLSTLRSVLADEVETILTGVDGHYSGQVVQYYRPEVDHFPARRRLLDIMGVSGTIKYAEVLHVTDVPDSTYFTMEQTASGSMIQVPQRFQVSVWRGLEDASTLADSTQSDWDALIWDSPGGLIHTLRTGDMHIESGGVRYFYNQPSPAQEAERPMDHDQKILAHYVEFTIEITT